MGSAKHRWKISFHRSTTPSKWERKEPPKEFICPISKSLMADPVIVSSGQTFDRICVQVCKNLGFTPTLSDDSIPDFSTVIPNLAIKATILKWCDSSRTVRPQSPDYGSIEKLVRTLMAEFNQTASESDKVRVSERELLENVAETPPVMFSHAATELNHRSNHFYSSSEESVIANFPETPLPLATRPSCFSSASSSSCSSSSEIVHDETQTLSVNRNPSSSEEEELVAKLKCSDVFEQEQSVISLRKITRTKEEARVSLCTPRLLAALRLLLFSRYSVLQTNAVAAIVNLSLEKCNKVKIVRAGIVPPLVDLLKGRFPDSQEHAAGALFSLALEDENKMAIGVLGALPPLLHALRSESERTRHDSAMALYHLSLVQSNRVKLVKNGAIPTLLAMARSGYEGSRVLLVLCNLAMCAEGRSALLDGNAVACLVAMLRGNELGSESTRENCVAALYSLSQGSLRFKALAKDAGLVEVLREVEGRGSERGREKAKRMLEMLKGGREGEEGEVDWEGVLESGELSRTRYRVGANSTEF